MTINLPENQEGERLQKVLAGLGLGSRREIEKAIEQGRVQVNGENASLGDRVSPEDKVIFDGRNIPLEKAKSQPIRVLLYNKPEGEICTRNDPEGRKTVFERLPRLQGARWISVGRLDINTSGLLLFTTDGNLANRLMHPSSEIDREYLVRIQGDEVDEAMKKRLKEGVMLEDGVAKFTDIVNGESKGANRWFYCVVMEGRNREVRRLWESQGVSISRLKRVRFGNIFIPSHVRAGQWLELDNKEIIELCKTAGIAAPRALPPLRPQDRIKRQRHQKKLRKGGAKRPKH